MSEEPRILAAQNAEPGRVGHGGFGLWSGYLDAAAQASLVEEIWALAQDCSWFRPVMPRTGAPFSVEMINLGRLGWVSDRERGYRYQATHPVTGAPWPPIPASVLAVWRSVSGFSRDPDCCLVNLYRPGAKMGLHQDRDERDFSAPVVSISLGDRARFRVGGLRRTDPATPVILSSGDVCVLEGEKRLAFHGIDRIYPGTSDLVPGGGRLNLTLRVVE